MRPIVRRSRRAARDFALGVRFAFAGGRSSAARLTLAAVGVALSVTALLLIAAVPGAMARANDRESLRAGPVPVDSSDPAVREPDVTILVGGEVRHRGTSITVVHIETTGPGAPTPPGLTRVPAPGELAVSPALRRLLESDEGALLRPRLPGALVADIGDDGLSGPRELFAYAGAVDLVAENRGYVSVVRQFAVTPWSPIVEDTTGALLMSIAALVAIVPMIVLVAAAARLGSATRDRRLAAIRLIGLDRRAAARVVTGETLVGVVAGLVVGGVGFVVARQLAPLVDLGGGISVFAHDLTPPLPALAAVAVLVLLVAVTAGIVALRPVLIEPLGVVREVPVPRRLWWRLLPLATGSALLAYVAAADVRGGETILAGAGLVMLSAPLMLPWLVERALRVLPDRGPTSWELARGALRADGGAAARVLGTVAAALVGFVAFHVLAVGLHASSTQAPSSTDLVSIDALGAGGAPAAEQAARDSGVVTASWTYRIGMVTDGPLRMRLIVADCEALSRIAQVRSCADGDTFLTTPSQPQIVAQAPAPGSTLTVGAEVGAEAGADGTPWVLPADVEPATALDGVEPAAQATTVLATPAAGPGIDLARAQVVVRLDPAEPDAAALLSNAMVGDDRLGAAVPGSEQPATRLWNVAGKVLTGGALLMLAIGVGSLVVLAVEHTRARRTSLATLVAAGCRRRLLVGALAWQLAAPTALAVAVAVAVGMPAGVLLLRATGVTPLVVTWSGVVVIVIGAAVAVPIALAMALPVLRRACRLAELRAE